MTTSGAVSPIARDIAKILPVKIPGIAAGRTTRKIVCHFVAPIPYEASRCSLGTARMASCAATIITGKINKLIVKPAAKTLLPSPIMRTKIVKPSNPKTMEGTPARFEIFIRIKSLILFFLAYSSK